nr:hypothetical protein [Flavobacterium sp.]
MNNQLLFQNIKNYTIRGLPDLEESLVGLTVTVFDDEYNESKEITIKLSKIHHSEILEKDLNKYANYIVKLGSEGDDNVFYQKLNYVDFLNKNNDLLLIIEDEWQKKEVDLIKMIDAFIENNYSSTGNIKHFINKNICDKLELSITKIKLNFDEDDNFTFLALPDIFYRYKINPEISEIMKFVLDRILNFYKVVIVKYSAFFNETEFSKHIKGITINNQNEVEDKLLSLSEIISVQTKKLINYNFYDVLKNRYPNEQNQESIIATIFRLCLNQYNIKYHIIDTATHYYNFCYKIGLIEHLESQSKTGLEIATILHNFSTVQDESLKVMTIKTFENNYTNRANPKSTYYPFSNKSEIKLKTILKQLNLT